MQTTTLELRGATSPVEPHLVQFFAKDEVLTRAIADFIATGVRENDLLLVIVTPSYAQRLAAVLPPQAVVLDSREVLGAFMHDGQPDPALFHRVLGGKVSELLGTNPGKKLRAFTDLIDLLWREDNSPAALRIEELWTELQRQHAQTLACAYVLGRFLKGAGRQPDASDLSETVRSLVAEVAQHEEIQRALRNALRQQHKNDAAMRATQQQLHEILDEVPALVSYVDREHRYRFVNKSYGTWFGVEPSSLVGRHMRDVLGESMYAFAAPRLEAALQGQPVHYETMAAYRLGPPRNIEATYTPHRALSGDVIGVTVMVQDVTEKVRLREATRAAVEKTERLLKITSALAAAVTPEQVFEALVDQAGAEIGSTGTALWLLGDDGHIRLARSVGIPDDVKVRFADVALDDDSRLFPALDALRRSELLWISNVAEAAGQYPAIAPRAAQLGAAQVACVPLVVQGKKLAVISYRFDAGGRSYQDEQPFLLLIARYGGQALERLRHVRAEQRSRMQAELLFDLAQTVIRANTVDEIFPPTLEAIDRALGAKRAAILLYDESGVMRFRASRGLSEAYRDAVEGHSPWARDAHDPQLVWVGDAQKDPSLTAYRELLASERIAALGFIPLVSGGRLLGKFMVYYEHPRELGAPDRELARAIANHIAAATARFQALDELQQTVRFNEMFTAILGHDLRNPLGAIMTAAQLMLKRTGDEKLTKPLSRVMSSGGRMARMIDQLLDFTRVRVGQGIPLHPKPIDLKPVVEQVIAELDSQRPEVQVKLEVTGETSGVWDADRLAQVFSNLVGNALQHGEDAQPITVRLDGSEAGVLRASVHNSGVVPPNKLRTLFEPMTGSDRRGEKAQGLGLGLYITREIARAHGGSITVESAPPTGTFFRIVLPRAPA